MSMTNKLIYLNTIKGEIKDAINNNGGNVGEVMSEYPQAIADLSAAKTEETKQVTLDQNGTYEIFPDEGNVIGSITIIVAVNN